MNVRPKALATLAAILIASVSPVHSQIVTASTLPDWSGSLITFSAGQKMGQTFTGVIAVQSMTYTFLTAAASNSAAGQLTATFGEWNGGSFVGTPTSVSTITVPASATWESSLTVNSTNYKTFDAPIDLSFTLHANLNPTLTYALMLTSETNTGFGLGIISNGSDEFTYGYGFPWGNQFTGADWTFTQIGVVPEGNELPTIPESSTVAALLGAALVGGLVTFRLRQRRQQLAPVATAA